MPVNSSELIFFKEGDLPVDGGFGGLPSSRNHDDFPTLQLFILAICRVAEPIALTSIFPYSWAMVKDFHVGDKNNASFYSGILIAAFCLAEAVSGMFWGSYSDKVGRKPVLLMGCMGTMLSLILVGSSTNYWMALSGRIIGGLLNGNIGCIQTMVGELVKKPEHEPRAFAVMPFVWSIGTIIGPAIGGTFASPSRTHPSIFSPNGLFGKLPYLLPNLICAALLFLSIVAGYLLLEETHPDLQPWSAQGDLDKSVAETPLIATAGAMADSSVDLRTDSYGTFNAVDIRKEQRWKLNPDGTSRPASFAFDKKAKFLTWRVSMLIVALGIFTYHSMTFDHLLPIFLQDDRIDGSDLPVSAFNMPGGLGLKIQTVGVIMSVNGLIALFIQAVIFPIFAAWLGVWRVFVMVTIIHPLCYYIVPYLVWLPDNLVFPGIYTCLAIRNFTSILAYPVLLILLKQASPSGSVLGKINGLAASAGAACRTVAPPVAGLLYGIGINVGFTGLAWWCSSLVALVGALQLWLVDRENRKNVVVRAVVPCLSSTNKQGQKDEIHIMVIETAEV